MIEALVSIAILAVIGGALSGMFTVGFHAIAPGGPLDRLAGAHDFMSLEQALGKDAARSACVQVHGGATYGQNAATSTCRPLAYGKVTACASASSLCFGWPQVSDSSCHVAVYVTTGSAPKMTVKRSEYKVVGGATTSVAVGTLTEDTVNFQLGTPATTTVGAPGYTWLRTLPVSITATSVTAGQFTQTLSLHPTTTDPGGASSEITLTGSPC